MPGVSSGDKTLGKLDQVPALIQLILQSEETGLNRKTDNKHNSNSKNCYNLKKAEKWNTECWMSLKRDRGYLRQCGQRCPFWEVLGTLKEQFCEDLGEGHSKQRE